MWPNGIIFHQPHGFLEKFGHVMGFQEFNNSKPPGGAKQVFLVAIRKVTASVRSATSIMKGA